MQVVQTAYLPPALVEEHVSTQTLHKQAVELVIQTMYQELAEPLTLEDLADVACLSPYYFSRVFLHHIGIPPIEFLSTLRLDAAKRLLLTTDLSVTDICFSVGYNGLGSFTTRFSNLVGLSPRQLRYRVHTFSPSAPLRRERPQPAFPTRMLTGSIEATEPLHHHIFVGLFPKPIPQGRPVTCTLLKEPGPFQLLNVPEGRYYLRVAAIPVSTNPLTTLLPSPDLRVGLYGPFIVAATEIPQNITIVLRPRHFTDPPIISALSFL